MKEIELRNRKNQVVAKAIVDDADYEGLCKYKWCVSNTNAIRKIPDVCRTLSMGRHILGLTHEDIDKRVVYANKNGLDCRRENLSVRVVKTLKSRKTSNAV